MTSTVEHRDVAPSDRLTRAGQNAGFTLLCIALAIIVLFLMACGDSGSSVSDVAEPARTESRFWNPEEDVIVDENGDEVAYSDGHVYLMSADRVMSDEGVAYNDLANGQVQVTRFKDTSEPVTPEIKDLTEVEPLYRSLLSIEGVGWIEIENKINIRFFIDDPDAEYEVARAMRDSTNIYNPK